MLIVFSIGAVSVWALGSFGRDPLLFVLLGALIYFTWGEIYSLFPATCTDAFGAGYATTNAGLLYTAKGTAALLVPAANLLMLATGSWNAVFLVAAAMYAIAAVMAVAVLKPMRAAHHRALAADLAEPARSTTG